MSPSIACAPLVISRNQACGQNLVKSTKIKITKNDLKKTHGNGKIDKKKDSKGKKSHKQSSRKGCDNHKLFSSPKEVSDESGLTEELEKPQENLGYLSDGSHSSKRRKKVESPLAVDSLVKAEAAPVAGNPLRIRFVFKKPKAEVATPPQKEQVCSTSVRQDVVLKKSEPEEDRVCSTSVIEQDVIITSPKISDPEEDLVCSTSVAKSLNHKDVITSSASSLKISELPSTSVAAETKKKKKHRPSREDRYNALFDDWTPMPICFVEEPKDDDDDWLFGNKTQVKLNPKAKIDEDMSRPGDSSWPRAQYLSEVGIHALPYTVPF